MAIFDQNVKMDPVLKAEWVEALRSGKYKQGREYLNVDGKLCCLGVLCEISHERFGFRRKVIDNEVTYNRNGSMPDAQMCLAMFGVPHTPYVKIRSKVEALEDHNDNGRRFKTIAKAIEEQL